MVLSCLDSLSYPRPTRLSIHLQFGVPAVLRRNKLPRTIVLEGSYNYFRDYDPGIGRYEQSDPIGLQAGPNTYGYVLAIPLRLSDFYGLDVLVCCYGYAAGGAGHVGFGTPESGGTSGFYPGKGESAFGGGGAVLPDKQSANRFDACKVIPADDKQGKCMEKCKLDRSANPGAYHFLNRNCTMFARDCLATCGLPTGSGTGPAPERFFHGLPGWMRPW